MGSSVIRRNMFYGASRNTFERAAELRKNMTLAELILWKKLKDKKVFKAKFRRQHPIKIFIVDFYCHEYKLAIELDGEVHRNKKNYEYDSCRTNDLEKLGVKVLRFSNEQITFNIESIIERILKTISELNPLKGGRGTD
jgi:very-short-patch-repair endonuclease